MASKMSQVCRREDLNWVSGKSASGLQPFEYGHVGRPVIAEDVPQELYQLINLDRRWVASRSGNLRTGVIHDGFMCRQVFVDHQLDGDASYHLGSFSWI